MVIDKVYAREWNNKETLEVVVRRSVVSLEIGRHWELNSHIGP